MSGTTKTAWISEADVRALNVTHNGDRQAVIQDLIVNHGFDADSARRATEFLNSAST